MTAKGRTVLVVGGGAREHALSLRLLESESVRKVVVVPGNAGIELETLVPEGKELKVAAGAPEAVARALMPELVVVGPEAPLCAGLGDELRAAGLTVFGPSRLASELEGSKAFMKELCAREGIRTAPFRVVSSQGELEAALAAFAEPPVVKADGLCAGKGVVVADSFDEARKAASAMLDGSAFGDAGKRIVLEERLRGAEASVHAICDGERLFMLPAAQDHKRIGEGDTGPNTGGMGAYAPAPLITQALSERIEREMLGPLLSAMARAGRPFIGAMFAGLMVSPEGEPSLLEINVRFGDPEAEVLMSLLDGDFAELLASAARGRLEPGWVRVNERSALCVVLAAANYPEAPRAGDAIIGLERAQQLPSVRAGQARIYHAGTRRDGAQVVTSGGRVLTVTGAASSLEEARNTAYEVALELEFAGRQLRRDIGHRALGRRAS